MPFLLVTIIYLLYPDKFPRNGIIESEVSKITNDSIFIHSLTVQTVIGQQSLVDTKVNKP